MRVYEHFSFDRSQVSPTVPKKLGSIFCGVGCEISVLSYNKKKNYRKFTCMVNVCRTFFNSCQRVSKNNKIHAVYPKNKYISFMNTF